MQKFNIVDPNRDDFAERVVSPEAEPSRRQFLISEVREMLAKQGTISEMPFPTSKYTSEELLEMGFIGIVLQD